MLTQLLPERLRPAAKAVVAAAVPILTGVVIGVVTGHWDTAALVGALPGLISALLVYQTPNDPA